MKIIAALFLALLASTVTLTVEEGIHLYVHPQGWPPDNLSLLHAPGCLRASDDQRVLRCPIDGYNSAVFMCSDAACRFKEPVNGTSLTPSEERIWNVYMRKRTRQETIELQRRLQDGTLNDSMLKAEAQRHD